jgi:NAD(P)-dependent dehydrogenase (short-subunit alcohol dehydrogenase family)
MQNIENKVAVVTGAASGIGLGIAKALVAHGVNVAMLDVEENALVAAHESLDTANVDVQRYVTDVASRDAMGSTAAAVQAHFGKVHILCNNAGVAAGGAVDECSYDDWDWVLGVNLNGVINGMTEFLPLIKAHGDGGHIVNTSSVLGQFVFPGQSIYCASKYAVVGISEASRMDLAPHNIGVSVLCPGMINTAILRSDRNRPDALGASGGDFDEALLKQAEAAFATGMDPDRVGEMVVAGIVEDKAYIFTHASFEEQIRARFEGILAGFDGSQD